VVAIVGVFALDIWLGTCGFQGCPSPREIQAYHPDEGGRIFDRTGRLMGRLAIVRRTVLSFVVACVALAMTAAVIPGIGIDGLGALLLSGFLLLALHLQKKKLPSAVVVVR